MFWKRKLLRMIEKIVVFLIALLVSVGIALWQKIKAWRRPCGETDDAGVSKPAPKPLVILQGVAGSFIVSEPATRPGSKEYEKVRRPVIEYPQTREGAEAFLTAMAKERNGSWVSTAVEGVAEDNTGRAMRNKAISLMTPLEEVNLYSKAEDSDNEDEETEEVSDPESDKSSISVEFVGDRVGFLKPELAAEIVRAKEEERARMLSFVLEITGISEEDRGIDIGILRWEERDETEAA
jgi:hypothetical protein